MWKKQLSIMLIISILTGLILNTRIFPILNIYGETTNKATPSDAEKNIEEILATSSNANIYEESEEESEEEDNILNNQNIASTSQAIEIATSSNLLQSNKLMNGEGTKESPYIITSVDELDMIRENLSAHYKLGQDIYFDDEDFKEGGKFYNEGAGWLPIGDSKSEFKGSLDGNGFAIKNLCLTYGGGYSENAYGLFSYLDRTAEIANLNIDDVKCNNTNSTSYYSFISVLVGDNYGTIKNVNVNGDILIVNGYYGTIAGQNHGSIEKCFADIKIEAKGTNSRLCIGGIVGQADTESKINNSYSKSIINIGTSNLPDKYTIYVGGFIGAVSGNVSNSYSESEIIYNNTKDITSCIGGFLGSYYYDWDDIIVENCYSKGQIDILACTDEDSIGGFSGTSMGSRFDHFRMNKCYTATEINCQSENIKNVASFAGDDCTSSGTSASITNCYYDKEMAKIDKVCYPKGELGLTTEQMYNQMSYEQWDFNQTWGIENYLNDGYPFLRENNIWEFGKKVLLVKSNPPNKYSGVKMDDQIEIVFSEPIIADENFITLCEDDTDANVEIDIEIRDNKIIIRPQEKLKPFMKYYVYILDGAISSKNNVDLTFGGINIGDYWFYTGIQSNKYEFVNSNKYIKNVSLNNANLDYVWTDAGFAKELEYWAEELGYDKYFSSSYADIINWNYELPINSTNNETVLLVDDSLKIKDAMKSIIIAGNMQQELLKIDKEYLQHIDEDASQVNTKKLIEYYNQYLKIDKGDSILNNQSILFNGILTTTNTYKSIYGDNYNKDNYLNFRTVNINDISLINDTIVERSDVIREKYYYEDVKKLHNNIGELLDLINNMHDMFFLVKAYNEGDSGSNIIETCEFLLPITFDKMFPDKDDSTIDPFYTLVKNGIADIIFMSPGSMVLYGVTKLVEVIDFYFMTSISLTSYINYQYTNWLFMMNYYMQPINPYMYKKLFKNLDKDLNDEAKYQLTIGDYYDKNEIELEKNSVIKQLMTAPGNAYFIGQQNVFWSEANAYGIIEAAQTLAKIKTTDYKSLQEEFLKYLLYVQNMKNSKSTTLLIECPVYVEILDINNNVVFTIENDKEYESNITPYCTFYLLGERRDKKLIMLKEGYHVNIIPEAEGAMNIGVETKENSSVIFYQDYYNITLDMNSKYEYNLYQNVLIEHSINGEKEIKPNRDSANPSKDNEYTNNGSSSGGGGGGGSGGSSSTGKTSAIKIPNIITTQPNISSGTWIKEANNWKLKKEEDLFATNQWALLDGRWYVFNSEGYMMTGMCKVNNIQYYFNPDGTMATGWVQQVNIWYYFDPSSGAMKNGWIQIDNKWYYLKSDGILLVSTITPDGYSVNDKGEWIQ